MGALVLKGAGIPDHSYVVPSNLRDFTESRFIPALSSAFLVDETTFLPPCCIAGCQGQIAAALRRGGTLKRGFKRSALLTSHAKRCLRLPNFGRHSMRRALAEFVQKQIARSRVGTHLAIKLKRQCEAIVRTSAWHLNKFGHQWGAGSHQTYCSTIKILHRCRGECRRLVA